MPILGNLKSNQHDSTVQRRQGGGIFRERSGRSEKKHAWKWKEERMVYRETKNNYISKKEVESSSYVSTRYIKSLNDFFFFVHPVYIHILTYIHALYNVCLAVLERIAIRRIGGVIFCS